MLTACGRGPAPVQSMTTRFRRCRRSVALAAALAIAAAPALAQPIEAGSQDVFGSPAARDGATPGRGQAGPDRPARRGFRPFRQELDAASPDMPSDLPSSRDFGEAPPYGGYGTNGFGNGAGDGDMAEPGYDGNGYREGRRTLVAPFGGGPGYQTPIPLGAGSLYSGSAVNGTAVGPQYSNQLPAYGGRFRR
jgi:hypothetical protein